MADSTDYCVVLITTDGEQEGQRVANALLERKLVACVNVVPAVSSLYWWKGNIDSATESMLVAKTKRAVLDELASVVQEAHSYEVPEIIALPIIWGSSSYLDWIDDEVKGP